MNIFRTVVSTRFYSIQQNTIYLVGIKGMKSQLEQPVGWHIFTRRTMTKVGGAPSVYEVTVESPTNVSIIVEPRTLTFRKGNQKVNYTVKFESKIASDKKSSGHHEFGQVSWKYVEGVTQKSLTTCQMIQGAGKSTCSHRVHEGEAFHISRNKQKFPLDHFL